MDRGLSRRGVLAGLGAAVGAAAVAAAPAASAAPLPSGEGLEPFDPNLTPTAVDVSRAGVTLTPGLTYDILDPTAFSGQDGARIVYKDGVGLGGGGNLFAPLRLPVGAALREVTLAYINPSGVNFNLLLLKLTPGSFYTQVGSLLSLAAGVGSQTATLNVTEPTTDGSFTYMVDVFSFAANRRIQSLRVGYVPPPQAFVAMNPVPRVLDTRISGGKLQNNEERVVPLGVPGFARAAVINLTVTETENAGFVAAFPADKPWPGNSSINWSSTNQNLANSVITAVDSTGHIKIRGGVNPTHVVIDVQGYLL